MIAWIFLIAALVLAILAALNVPSGVRFSLGWGALACYFASLIAGRL